VPELSEFDWDGYFREWAKQIVRQIKRLSEDLKRDVAERLEDEEE